MGVRSAAARILGRFASRPGKSTSGAALFDGADVIRRTEPPLRSTLGMMQAYSTSPVLRSVVDRLASGVGLTQWRLNGIKQSSGNGWFHDPTFSRLTSWEERNERLDFYRKAGRLVSIDQHPFWGLWNTPCEPFSGIQLRELTQVYQELAGDALWCYGRDTRMGGKTGRGVVRSVWPLPPHWIFDMPHPDRPYYAVKAPFGSFQAQIPVQDVLRFLTPDPNNPYGRGAGLFASLSDEIDVHEMSSKMTSALLANNAIPPAIVIDRQSHTDAQKKQFVETYMAKIQGFWKVAAPLFVSRDVDIKVLQRTFADLGLMDLMRFGRDQFVQTAGLPPELQGIMENATRATIGTVDYFHSRWNLVPRLERMRLTLQTKFLNVEFDEKLVLDYVSPVAKDDEFALRAASFAPWGPTLNEWRDKQGLPPVEDGTGDLHFIPTKGYFGKITETPADQIPRDTSPDPVGDGTPPNMNPGGQP